MNLDFRLNASLEEDITPLFGEVATSCRKKYNDIVTSASNPILSNIDWWSENASSRNTYASALFHNVCCIELLKTIIDKDLSIPKKIIVDSKELLRIIQLIKEEYLLEGMEIVYREDISKKVKSFLRYFYYEWFCLVRMARIILSRVVPYKKSYINTGKPLVLIDTFITSSYINEDRWYGSFWDHLDREAKKEIFFVPSVVDSSLTKFYRILKGIRSSERNYILKEDYLTFTDVVYAYKHKYRVKSIQIGKCFLGKTDITGLVEEDLFTNRDIHSIMESLLTYRFLKNLSLTSLNIRLFIDWFEGHSLDKMWNLGIHNFFPNTKRIAYETFRSFPFYLSTYPIEVERKAEVIPDVFAVQGVGCIEPIREFLPKQEVISVPAFKNEYIWKDRTDVNLINKVVLVAFPISVKTSAKILDFLIENSINSASDDIIYELKPHPVVKASAIRKLLKNQIPKNFRFTKERIFHKLLFKSSLLITEASSVCLEALAVGKPVIIIENTSGLTYDPIPNEISKDMYMKCKSVHELEFALKKFLFLSQDEILTNVNTGKKIREHYFEPVTKEGLNRFLDLRKIKD